MTISMGDDKAAKTGIALSLEDVLVGTVSTAAGEFASQTYNARVDDQRLDIRFNLLSSTTAAVNALRITRTAVGEVSWQNQIAFDVNDDGQITSLDALAVINYLNSRPGEITIPPPPAVPGPLYDVSGDGRISPIDALIVIDYLNSILLTSGGEGESQSSRPSSRIPLGPFRAHDEPEYVVDILAENVLEVPRENSRLETRIGMSQRHLE